MEGELQAVRDAAKASAEAAGALVTAADKLMLAIKKNQANIAELDAKADRLAVVTKQLEEASAELARKQQNLTTATEKLAKLKAEIPA